MFYSIYLIIIIIILLNLHSRLFLIKIGGFYKYLERSKRELYLIISIFINTTSNIKYKSCLFILITGSQMLIQNRGFWGSKKGSKKGVKKEAFLML